MKKAYPLPYIKLSVVEKFCEDIKTCYVNDNEVNQSPFVLPVNLIYDEPTVILNNSSLSNVITNSDKLVNNLRTVLLISLSGNSDNYEEGVQALNESVWIESEQEENIIEETWQEVSEAWQGIKKVVRNNTPFFVPNARTGLYPHYRLPLPTVETPIVSLEPVTDCNYLQIPGVIFGGAIYPGYVAAREGDLDFLVTCIHSGSGFSLMPYNGDYQYKANDIDLSHNNLYLPYIDGVTARMTVLMSEEVGGVIFGFKELDLRTYYSYGLRYTRRYGLDNEGVYYSQSHYWLDERLRASDNTVNVLHYGGNVVEVENTLRDGFYAAQTSTDEYVYELQIHGVWLSEGQTKKGIMKGFKPFAPLLPPLMPLLFAFGGAIVPSIVAGGLAAVMANIRTNVKEK